LHNVEQGEQAPYKKKKIMGTGKTGGHWKPCNIGSVEAHNERRPEYLESVKNAGLSLYFFEHLTEHNDHWVNDNARYKDKTVADVFEAMKNLYKEKTGQLPQLAEKKKVNKKTGKEYKCAGWSPIREMCPPIKADTKIEDFDYLKKWAKKHGIEIIRIDLHKDEGYHDKDTGEYKMNYHAHVVASFLDWNTGKTVKPNSQAMSEMQTILAMALNMERGERKADTGKQYLDQVEYREMMESIDGEKKKITEEAKKEAAGIITEAHNAAAAIVDEAYKDAATIKQSTEDEHQSLKAEIKKAETRLKGLTTMLANLEAQKDNLEAQIAALENEYAEDKEQMEQKRSELQVKLTGLEEKIAEKQEKFNSAEQQLRDINNQFTRVKEQKEKYEKDIRIMTDDAIKRHDHLNKKISQKREELTKIDKSGELARAQKHIEQRNDLIYKRWPKARNAVDAIFQLGNSPTATDFTPQQALHVEHAIVTSGTDRTEAARDLLSLAQKDFDNQRTPGGWVDNAAKVVQSIAQRTHQRLTALLKQQPKDNNDGPSYITDLTDWAGNQIHR